LQALLIFGHIRPNSTSQGQSVRRITAEWRHLANRGDVCCPGHHSLF